MNRRFCARWSRIVGSAVLVFATGQVAAQYASAPPASPAKAAQEVDLSGFERLGSGKLAALRKDNHVIVAVPADALRQLFVWYAELVSAPPQLVANEGLEVANVVAQFERQNDMIIIRDMSEKVMFRGGQTPATPTGEPSPLKSPIDTGISSNAQKLRPIDVALNQTKIGPVLASFPILAEAQNGTVLIDVTKVFSSEIAGISPRKLLSSLGVMPTLVDPERSWIDKVRVFNSNLNIRSHLTFLAGSPTAPADGLQPLSVVVGHSILFLPQQPMVSREYDPRVGFFWTDLMEYESAAGAALDKRRVITRFRLEKANPDAAVSDPVKPITFYLGRGIPARWKPWVKQGVLRWLPVFEAAGFSNAIRVLDAPDPKDDPNWSAEDVGINVIRWVPQDRINAMGPHTTDPRTGETLSAHVQIWPSVLDGFGRYYFGLFHTVDPEANTQPLPEAKLGGILAYAVAHEIGHTLGLRHNQMASTAWSVAQLRDPKFANVFGPNSSIMAYGRFNQAAQPGDGVTKFHADIGPYDYAAIKWGYAVFDKDPVADRKAVKTFAAKFTQERALYWGAAEILDEWDRFVSDPRIQTENVGADRLAATRLGVSNNLRTLAKLDAATKGNQHEFVATLNTMMATQTRLLKSVASLVGGTMPRIGSPNDAEVDIVPAAEQRAAVVWLLGEGARTLDAWRAPALVQRAAVVGGERAVDDAQAALVAEVLSGGKITILDRQAMVSTTAYSPAALGRDVAQAVMGEQKTAPAATRALQRGWIVQTRKLITGWSKASTIEPAAVAALKEMGLPTTAAGVLAETGDKTTYPAWLRGYLPTLAKQLTASAQVAGNERDRLHFEDMAAQVEGLVGLLRASGR